jgi:hypothetical protein
MNIINQDKDLVVPEKTIAVFPLIPDKGIEEFDMNFNSFLKPLNLDHKRGWFHSDFYHCLPLSIGNMQGFSVSVPFGFDVIWNGGNSVEDVSIIKDENYNKFIGVNAVDVKSEFGYGIITIHLPITLKTPPGVNLMTIAPPNFPVVGLSPMTGVVESDNIRFTFTINIKIDIPNTIIRIEKDAPLAGILPIPRYFCDSFELKNANEIFTKEVIEDERLAIDEHGESRDFYNQNKLGLDRLYYKGVDIRNNKFKDHQLPIKNKKI